MLKRNSVGRLSLNSIDLQIFLCDLFELCDNVDEVMWLQDQIKGTT